MDVIEIGDCRETMRRWIAEGVQVQTCITSPPYWGLRDYGVEGQLGLEPDYREFLANMVEVFSLVRQLLAKDGTLWLNIGDTYAGNRSYQVPDSKHRDVGNSRSMTVSRRRDDAEIPRSDLRVVGLKPKDLMMIPARLAIALQDDGWWLRQDIIWSKPNPMPESVKDRFTKSHEYIFLMSKAERYFFDAEAVKEPCATGTDARYERGRSETHKWADGGPGNQSIAKSFEHMRRSGNKERKPASARGVPVDTNGKSAGAVAGSVPWEWSMRNPRSVWTIPTQPFKGSHFATFPEALVERCILAGSRPGDVVFDPFMGSGTVAQVAQRLGRRYLGCELNPQYGKLQEERLRETMGMAL